MRKFILKLLFFCLWVLALTTCGLLIPRITPHQNLHFALQDKHNRLNRIAPPRIILVGGSNLSFGLNSQKIEQELHRPVINTSIHAGMGLKFIIDDIKPYIKRGDIVVLAPEYDHFYGETLWGYEPMVSSIFAFPSNYHLFNTNNWEEMMSALPKEALKNIAKFFLNSYRKLFNIDVTGIYDRDSFNAYGDVVAHYNQESEELISNDINSKFNPASIDVIKDFRQFIEGKNGIFLVTYPCLNKTSFNIYPDKIARVEIEFKKNKFQILGFPRRYSFDDSLYYNAKYHLTKDGVEKRTALLISDLKRALQ